jgi:hypothetical protein
VSPGPATSSTPSASTTTSQPGITGVTPPCPAGTQPGTTLG